MYSAPRAYVTGLPRPARCLVMGVVNVTPDSFSDGGLWFDPDAAIGRGLALAAEGADIVDIGGESTRPGAQRPNLEEELTRVHVVVRELSASGVNVSIDTMRAAVARAAIAAGAAAINDVSGGLADPEMLATAAELEVPYLCMHWRSHAVTMQERATYDDVVADVHAELHARADAALAAGIHPSRLALDPGLGFAKTADHNWQLLRRLEDLADLGFPLLVGASRKAFLGALLAGRDGAPRAPADRDDATAAVSTLVASEGAWCVRVHDVTGSLDAVRVVAAWAAGRPGV